MEFEEAYKNVTEKYNLETEVIFASEENYAIKAKATYNESGFPYTEAIAFYSSKNIHDAHKNAVIELAKILVLKK